jgi:hypothetical protein
MSLALAHSAQLEQSLYASVKLECERWMLRPLEFLYLLIAIAIVAQQMVVRGGQFDPVALAAVAFFIGLIPANRADKQDDGEDDVVPIWRLIRFFSGGKR